MVRVVRLVIGACIAVCSHEAIVLLCSLGVSQRLGEACMLHVSELLWQLPDSAAKIITSLHRGSFQ